MPIPDASAAGTLLLGGDMPVHRLGYGAMRITGEGIWGEPADRARCIATLRELGAHGVNFVDTADSYGPCVSEPLLHDALAPYAPDLVIATKAGQLRTGPNTWIPLGRPEYLKQQVKMSLRWLGVEQIALWQLHRIDPKVPRDEQFGAIREMLDAGLIRHAGLSAVSIEELEAARRVFPVASVQNRYSATWRVSEDVLDYCTAHGIAFIPYYPLGKGELAQAGSPMARIAARHHATPSQVALAWLLKRSPVMLPIPGTTRPEHLAENVAAASLALSDEEFEALNTPA